MENSVKKEGTPFKGVLFNTIATPEELERQATEMLENARAIRDKQEAEEIEKIHRERDVAEKDLEKWKLELLELDNTLAIAGKLSLADAKKLAAEKANIESEIERIEKKYPYLTESKGDSFEQNKAIETTTVWPTVAKIVSLLLACWGIVIYSGDWILEKYPNAAIYNDVSFQKVLFAFSVFIFGIASVIASLTVFFPGIGKYFNPFNREQLDFFNDFKKLSEWQRTVISVALFFALLLAFVLTVSGKLD